MRPIYLFLLLFCLLTLTACGTEKELTPPVFSNIMANGTTDTSTPFKELNVTITGNIDDFATTVDANSTASGEVSVAVDSSDGSWSFELTPLEGANIVTLTASDKRGNINQLILTIVHDTTAPLVTAVAQSIDPSPQLLVTFNEALLETSLTTAVFAVDGTPLSGATLDTLLTQKNVTLPLTAALPPGEHQLTCTGVTDLATLNGNSVAADYSFTFTIVE